MDNAEISKILFNISFLMDLDEGDSFRIESYAKAARAIEVSTIPMNKSTTEKELQRINGIGKGIAKHVKEILDTGTTEVYEELKQKVPGGFLDILRIPGLGPKRIKILYKELGIDSLEMLEEACKKNRVASLAGMGMKTQENIVKGIANVKEYQNKYKYFPTIELAESILQQLLTLPNVIRAEFAGSIRRRKEIVKDLDIVLASDDPIAVINAFVQFPEVIEIVAKGDTKASVKLVNGINADLRVVSNIEYPYTLMYFTGSKAHNIALRTEAIRQGYKLNEYGLFDSEDNLVELPTEGAVFNLLGMLYIPPELRENTGEVSQVVIPTLIEESDIKGMLHVHTKDSDGSDSIAGIALFLRERSYTYLGIADHSQSATYANGLSKNRLAIQGREIDRLNANSSFKIFKGVECDILKEGSLDYMDADFKELKLDFVIASVHTNFGLSEEDQTNRLIRAIENPYTTILGHPTGRLLLQREPYAVNMDKVIRACAANKVALEINCLPDRLDLDWRYCKYAKELGCKFAINTDAHVMDNFRFINLGIGIAKKGWLTKADVINTYTIEEFERWIRK